MSVNPVRQESDNWNQILKIGAGVFAIGVVAYIVKKSMESNRVAEECGEGVFTGRCLGAVVNTGAEVASDVAQVAAACIPPVAPGVCAVAAGRVLLSRVNQA